MIRLLTILLLCWLGRWDPALAQPDDQAHAPQHPLADSTAVQPGAAVLMADSLTARYAGLEGFQTDDRPPDRGVGGWLRYERTILPLRHAGDNIFQPVMDDDRLLTAIRRLKGNPAWTPFLPGQSGLAPYNYHYDADGATNNSHTLRWALERLLTPSLRTGFRLDTRYENIWGPFPNQHASQISGVGRFSTRLSPSHLATISLLGIDDGWHINDGNSVFTDRARYMLEGLNTWRTRSGGVEFTLSGQPAPSVSYRLRARLLSHQWASDPPDITVSSPFLLGFSTPNDSTPVELRQFVDGFFPVTFFPRFEARRTMRMMRFGADMAMRGPASHRVSFGVESRLHRWTQRQSWETTTTMDAFDLAVQPREYGLYVRDEFRFWVLNMGFGLRYDVYDPGDAAWRDVYQSVGENRTIQDDVRQFYLSAGGDSDAEHLLSPHIAVSYPYQFMNAHLSFSVSSQYPSFEDIYALSERSSSPYGDRSVTALYPQRLTTFEGGVGISRAQYTADITAFYRDTERFFPLFGPEALPQTLSNYASYWGRVDNGFQEQSGIELALVRRSAPVGRSRARLSGRLSYMYLFDLGGVREPDIPLFPHDPLNPGDLTAFDRRLNHFYNRRHWLSLVGALRLPSGITLTGVGHIQSGVPYLRKQGGFVWQTLPGVGPSGGGQIVPVVLEDEIRFGPWTKRFDARIDAPVRLGPGGPALTLFIEGRNLLDDAIIENIPDPRTFEQTGLPDNGLLSQPQWVYGPARSIWTGIGLRW